MDLLEGGKGDVGMSCLIFIWTWYAHSLSYIVSKRSYIRVHMLTVNWNINIKIR